MADGQQTPQLGSPEAELVSRLVDEYKILQDKTDKIGAFRFTIKGWSITVIIASILAGTATNAVPRWLWGASLIAFLAVFFWFERQQTENRYRFGRRLLQIEAVLWLWGSARYPTFYDLLAILLGLFPFLIAGILILYRRKTRNKWIRKEADKWLALRRTVSVGAVHQCVKIERRTLWGPTAVVLLLFLFFPETTAIISHVFHGRSATVGPYRIATPMTWTIIYKEPSFLSILYAKGIGREGFRPYWDHDELQLMGFRAISPDQRADAAGTSKTRKSFQRETCT